METVRFWKKIIVAIIILLLLTNVITSINTVVYGQPDVMGTNIFSGFIRFALAGSVLYFLYAGNKVAKWLIVIITLMGGISGFLSVLLAFSSVLIAISIINMAMAIIYISIGIVLIISSPVNNFLRFQHENIKVSNDIENEN